MKKFFSAILLMAAMVFSVSTFVACNDLVDDVEAVKSQTTQNAADIAAIKAQIVVLEKGIADAKQAAADAKTFAEQCAAEAKAEALAKIAEYAASNDAQIATIKGMIQGVEADLDVLEGKVDEQAKKIANIELQIAALEKYNTETQDPKIDKLIEDLKSANADIDELRELIAALDEALVVLQGETLRALVFDPQLYVDGIEAAEYIYCYYPWDNGSASKASEVDPDGNVVVPVDAKAFDFANSENFCSYDPVNTVAYYMNPSSADLSGAELTLYAKTVEHIMTKVGADVEISVNNFTTDKGMVLVDYVVDGEALMSNYSAGYATVFALNAEIPQNEKDTTITSDFARVYPSYFTPTAIAYNDGRIAEKECPAGSHLYYTVQNAIKNEATFQVGYKDILDLNPYLEFHFTYTRPDADGVDADNVVSLVKNYANPTDRQWLADNGFKVVYTPINLQVSDNKTNDTKYAVTSDLLEGRVNPCAVRADGSQDDNTPGQSAIGRQPIVLVTLVDADNHTVCAGYIKIEIVKDLKAYITKPFKKNHVWCNEFNYVLTWEEITDYVLESFVNEDNVEVSISKDQFDKLYQPSVKDGALVQFARPASNEGLRTSWKPAAKAFGKVVELNDFAGTTTSVLQWTLSACELEYIYNHENGVHTIYVAYEERPSTGVSQPSVEPAIFLPLTVTVTKSSAIETPVTYGVKIEEYWFGENLYKAMINVNRPVNGGSTIPWKNNLLQVWVANKLTWSDNYAGEDYIFYFAPDPIEFVGEDGFRYTLSVAETSVYDYCDATKRAATNETLPGLEKKYLIDGSKGVYTNNTLYCAINGGTPVAIAELVKENGVIYVHYLENATSKQVLNSTASVSDSERLTAKLYANIGVARTTKSVCKNVVQPVEAGIHPYYFLRPLNYVQRDGNKFLDAEANGSYVNVLDLLNFSDWRAVDFVDLETPNYKNAWLFAYYNVSKVEVDCGMTRTNLNNSDITKTYLKDITNEIIITYVDKDKKEHTNVNGKYSANIPYYGENSASYGTVDFYESLVRRFGAIKYYNNGNNVSEFDLIIPIYVTYDWGTIKVEAKLHVDHTMGM